MKLGFVSAILPDLTLTEVLAFAAAARLAFIAPQSAGSPRMWARIRASVATWSYEGSIWMLMRSAPAFANASM